jgi:hypothetical protein
MENPKNCDSFSMAIDDLACNFERLDDSSMQNIHEDAKQYFEKGSCRLENDIEVVCLNPTLLGHATLRWTLMDGWTFPVPI